MQPQSRVNRLANPLPCAASRAMSASQWFVSRAPRQNPGVWPGFCVRIKRVGCYFALFVVYQICGAPLTPDFSIAIFNAGDAANVLASSRLWKS